METAWFHSPVKLPIAHQKVTQILKTTGKKINISSGLVSDPQGCHLWEWKYSYDCLCKSNFKPQVATKAVTSNEESHGDEDHVPVCKRHNTSKGQQAVTTNEESDGDEDHIPACNRRNTSKGQKVRKYNIWEKSHEKKIHHRNLKDDARSKKD
ncbi:uncharacterized protein [Apostichopus japonicus]|uniref:uncharacterized protein isoform X1 n=1 Tax=Stichopus japonicus TaxID=307972 RepID=UPI003AB71423